MISRREWAREARGEIEAALDLVGWRWSRPLSLWVGALILIEERAGAWP